MARELSSSPQKTGSISPSHEHKNTSGTSKRSSMGDDGDDDMKSASASPYGSPQSPKQKSQSRSPSMASAERKESDKNISPTEKGIAVRVENLTRNVNTEHLTEIFAKFGSVTKVKLMTERDTKISKGSAVIEFNTDQDAENAIQHMHDGWLDGRKIVVQLMTEDLVEEGKARDQSSVGNGHNGDMNETRDSRKKSSSARAGRGDRRSPIRMNRLSTSRRDPNFRRGVNDRKQGGYGARSRSITRRDRSRPLSHSKSSVTRRRFASPFRPRRQSDDRRRSPVRGRGRGGRFQRRGRSSVSSSQSVSSRSKSYSRSRSRREPRRPVRRNQRRRSRSLSKSISSSNSSVSRSFSRSPSRSRSSMRGRRRASRSSSPSRSS
uniref:PREDICTED: RNAbinding protein S1 putative n=1 Tax=Albugo laibachii Nc14 TaxID=890382 RepID=F0W088_9STRA|nr:PREDICTED: similar to AGAP009570PA putative [Albugo laibachii Nc14]CCA21243.1 PREDICTED: RNAbinding protein S1 putative [Albugo laibachii Nc14]|eukprot:CCA21243.1 PREDICTED: RNAbinding protein S1 putative [Albugo laibachii Nc14]